MAVATLDHHLEATPGTCGGKVRIAGRRITVHQIAIWHERLGMPVEEIVEQYDLKPSDIYAALTFYFDHQEEIDREIEEDERFVEGFRAGAPSILDEKPELREQYERDPEAIR